MSDLLYEQLYSFLVFAHAGELTRTLGFFPSDSILLDSITQLGKKKVSARILVVDGTATSHDKGFAVVFTLDEAGEPKKLELVKS